jgi:hypothetical protein
MAVHDHGLEAIRKSSVLVTSGNTTEYKLRTFNVGGSLLSETYDYVSVAYPLATQEVYTFKSGGSGGTTVATITVNYTDSTKVNLSSVAKT